MYIEKIDGLLESFDLNSKFDEKGNLIPNDPREKVDNPCPKLLSKNEYKNQQDYENAKKEILDRYKAYADKFKDVVKKITLNNPKELPTAKTVVEHINKENKNVKGTENYIKDTNFLLSDSETKERERIQEKAFDNFSDIYALKTLGSHLIKSVFPKVDRTMVSFLMVDVYTPEEVIKDFETIVNGTEEEKQDLVNRKINVLKNTAIELSERKNSDEEYVDYFKKNFLNTYHLTEMDGSKINDVCNALKVPSPSGTAKDFVDKYRNQCNSSGLAMNILGRCLNPYYTRLNEKAGVGIELIEETDNEINVPKNYDIISAFKDGDNVIDNLTVYKSDTILSRENPTVKDNLLFLFMKNDSYAKMVDSKGNEYTNDVESFKEVEKKLIQGEKFVIYDKSGLYRTKMELTDSNFNSVPSTTKKPLERINFKEDPANSFKNIHNQMKKLNSIFSSDHQEYKDIKNYINSIDSLVKNGEPVEAICHNLRDLASKYVVSKAVNCKYAKTNRTYEREEFFTKLINSIDESYPIVYPDLVLNEEKENIEATNIINNDNKPVRMAVEMDLEENDINKDVVPMTEESAITIDEPVSSLDQ